MQVKQLLSSDRGKINNLQTPREVVYINNIFNVKRKFKILTPRQPDLLPFPKQEQQSPSNFFTEHADSIHRTRRILRRGLCGMPIHDYFDEKPIANSPKFKAKNIGRNMWSSRKVRMHTQLVSQSVPLKGKQIRLHTEQTKQQGGKKKNSLMWKRSMRVKTEQNKGISIDGSKYERTGATYQSQRPWMTRRRTTASQNSHQKGQFRRISISGAKGGSLHKIKPEIDTIDRRLAVEMVNNVLLQKMSTSSLKF